MAMLPHEEGLYCLGRGKRNMRRRRRRRRRRREEERV
jgi:hypothetical protein